MKHSIFTFILCFCSLSISAQEATTANSEAFNLMSKRGSFILKEFYPEKMIRTKTLEPIIFEPVIYTDMTNNDKVGSLRISIDEKTVTFITYFDYAELTDCINVFQYVKTVVNTKPQLYSDYIYTTRNNTEIGGYYNNKQKDLSNKVGIWSLYIYVPNIWDRTFYIDTKKIDELITILQEAKVTIEDALKQ